MVDFLKSDLIETISMRLLLSKKMKQKIEFALLMGIVTTGLISFTVIFVNLGFAENFLKTWLKSWMIAYLIVIPAILIIAPQIERLVGFLFGKNP